MEVIFTLSFSVRGSETCGGGACTTPTFSYVSDLHIPLSCSSQSNIFIFDIFSLTLGFSNMSAVVVET